MNLEEWLKCNDIKKWTLKNLEFYLSEYEKEEKEDFDNFFKGVNFEEIKYEFHSVGYVINMWHRPLNEEYKYISAKIRLEYKESTFAEYEIIYSTEGECEDDYLRRV